jgi:hypothetical protein
MTIFDVTATFSRSLRFYVYKSRRPQSAVFTSPPSCNSHAYYSYSHYMAMSSAAVTLFDQYYSSLLPGGKVVAGC